MKQKYEIFLMLFNQLKSKIDHSPKKLTWLTNEKPEIGDICYKLNETYKQINRHLSKQSNRSTIVPPNFSKNWDEYNGKYREKVATIASPLRDKYIKDMIDQLSGETELKGQSKEEFFEGLVDLFSSNTKKGDSFDPTEDNPYSLVSELLVIAQDIADLEMHGLGDKHIGAMQYFEDVIGVDLGEINFRWNKVPNLYLSENINKKTDKLIELYNEAARCYIFGLNVAATAMCRSLLEHILVEYYKRKEENLHDMIVYAEKKFNKIRSLNLHKLRKDGNSVMHDYEKKSKIEDQAVVEYLMTIRSLVDRLSNR